MVAGCCALRTFDDLSDLATTSHYSLSHSTWHFALSTFVLDSYSNLNRIVIVMVTGTGSPFLIPGRNVDARIASAAA